MLELKKRVKINFGINLVYPIIPISKAENMQIVEADEKKFERHNLIEKTIRGFTLPLLNTKK